MKFILAIISLLFVETLCSQVKPELFPEDLSTQDGPVRCYCKPGVRYKSRSKGLKLSFTSIGSGTYNDEENNLQGEPPNFSSWTRFEFDIKAPVINRDGFKFLLGFKHSYEKINIDRLGDDFPETFRGIDNAKLKKGNLSAIFTKSLDDKKYLGVRVRYSSNGNYNGLMNFEDKYAVYKALAVMGFKKSEDFEWGFGLNFSKSFRRVNLLPFVVYNRNFRNSWGIETAFPGYLYGRYNFSQYSILLFGMEYGSDSYRVDFNTLADEQRDYAFNHSELLSLIRLEQRFAPWVWGNLRFGYQMNFSTDFESKGVNSPEFMVDPSNGLFFEIGVFLSPPDHFGHK